MDYRSLTDQEILVLEDNGCWAEDWSRVTVADDFTPNYCRATRFYGDVRLGLFERDVEVSKDFYRHSSLSNATLRNVTIGDNCLIENIACFINNYEIGDDCHLAGIGIMETTEGATFGEGNTISLTDGTARGNAISYHGLTATAAALMVRRTGDAQLWSALRRIISEDIQCTTPDTGRIGSGVKIVNTREITNTVAGDGCEISGASRLCDCTIMSSQTASVLIGADVICEDTVVMPGASITNGVKMQDCFVGEECKLRNGLTASSCLFFGRCNLAAGIMEGTFVSPPPTDEALERLYVDAITGGTVDSSDGMAATFEALSRAYRAHCAAFTWPQGPTTDGSDGPTE